MMSGSYRARKRTKTFTGCWTCRSRRLKCDEQQPQCLQCTRKGLSCEGYSARLQWLPPDNGGAADAEDGDGDGDDVVSAGAGKVACSGRRQILAEPPLPILNDGEINKLLEGIEQERTESQITVGESYINGPFGIWNAGPSTVTPHIRNCSPSMQNSASNPAAISFESLTPTSIPEQRFSSATQTPVRLGGAVSGFSSGDINTHYIDVDTEVEDFVDGSPGSAIASDVVLNNIEIPYRPIDFEFLVRPETGPCFAWSVRRSSSERAAVIPQHNLHASWLSPDCRYLLEHYANEVVPILCVVRNEKSPWKTIHLPRAFQCAGELSVFGEASNARCALLYALLSISAYSLVNQYKTGEKDHAQLRKWSDMALQLRCKAVGFLMSALAEDMSSTASFKYKDVLAAMLSMVTVDVISGDTDSISIHLDGCEQLIRSVRGYKTKYSTKARALHRIFFYLRTIYSSTVVSQQGEHPELGAEEQELSSSTVEAMLNATSADDLSDWLDMTESSESDQTCCECIYGIPRSLLALMRKATRVVQTIIQMRQRKAFPEDWLSTSAYLQKVESEVLDWPIKAELARSLLLFDDDNLVQIVAKQTRAFHGAIIIYFSQQVRLMHHRFIRQFVVDVLDDLEGIESIKDRCHVLAGPLFWPAFIAASEAFDDELQYRFQAWFDRARKYGFSAALSGREMAREIWSKNAVTKGHGTSSWRSVAQEKQAHLMFT